MTIVTACHHMKSLSASGRSSFKILKRLLENDCASQFFLPELENIYLSNVVWRDVNRKGEATELTETLTSLVKGRVAAGLPLRKIIIRTCINLDRLGVKLIREAGAEVEWDELVTKFPLNL